MTVVVVALVAVTSTTQARIPTPDEVKALYTRLETARSHLARVPTGISASDASTLRSRIVESERAIQRFVDVAEKGRTRGRLMPVYAGAASVLFADDVTGVGAADDVLIPVIGVAALVTMIATQAPAPADDVDGSWVIASTAVSAAVMFADELRRRHAQAAAAPLAMGSTASGLSLALPAAIEEVARGICRVSDPRRFGCERNFSIAAVECGAMVFFDKKKQALEISECIRRTMNQLKQCCGWATPSSRN